MKRSVLIGLLIILLISLFFIIFFIFRASLSTDVKENLQEVIIEDTEDEAEIDVINLENLNADEDVFNEIDEVLGNI